MKIGSLKSMSVDALVSLRKNIDTLLTSKLESAKKDLQSKLSYLEGLFGDAPKAGTRKKRKVAAKYRGPNGESWAGRGMRPRWLTALIAEGRKVEEFAVGGGASARKKSAAKRAGRKGKVARRGRPPKASAA
jgi:DNA-binding protein H-NS